MYPTKRYPHFDKVIRFSDVESYVCDPQKIARHSFFPLVHYTKVSKRYNPSFVNKLESDCHKQHVKKKERDIMYAAHLDGYIYRYYADQLNARYNQMALKHHIDSVSIAYRDNKSGMSNIQFAQEAFAFIAAHPRCYIRVGDFEHFFDNLQHSYLKRQIKKVLQMESLPEDWYKVLRSVTHYTYVERMAVAPFYDKRSKCYFKSARDYRKFHREHQDFFTINRKGVGVPQGTALSGILANIYMLDIDDRIQKLVQDYGGMYRRYSDDTIIIIPIDADAAADIRKIDKEICKWIGDACLSEQEEKTKRYLYRDGMLYDALTSDAKRTIDYLGFTFDGREVKVRQKCIYKFERKANTAIHHAEAIKRAYNLEQLPFKSSILPYYFSKGHKPGKRTAQSNFLNYLDRVKGEYLEGDIICKPKQQVAHLNRKIRRSYNRVK